MPNQVKQSFVSIVRSHINALSASWIRLQTFRNFWTPLTITLRRPPSTRLRISIPRLSSTRLQIAISRLLLLKEHRPLRRTLQSRFCASRGCIINVLWWLAITHKHCDRAFVLGWDISNLHSNLGMIFEMPDIESSISSDKDFSCPPDFVRGRSAIGSI